MMLVGNWKMHGGVDFTTQLCTNLKNHAWPEGLEVAVLPPAAYVVKAAEVLAGSAVHWGAQNCHWEDQGAYTGEMSAAMFAELGGSFVLVGHSERRTLFGESDADVARKFQAAHEAGLTPILCVGETLAQREAGQTDAVIVRQLSAIQAMLPALCMMVVAYEPVWAIGTGQAASPEQAQSVHAVIRTWLSQHRPEIAQSAKILYGGSVSPDNAADLFAQADIDGALVGGASLDAERFSKIGDVCNKSF